MFDDETEAPRSTEQFQESDDQPAAKGLIQQQQAAEYKQQAADRKQNSDNTPKPIFPVRVWRKLSNWWTDPHRQRGNFPEHLTVFISIVIAIIAGFQWNVYRQQKKIMESSGQQTQKLIDAANIQASSAQKNAIAAASVATSAGKQADYAQSIAAQTLAQAKATNELARTSEESLVHTEQSLRPWVNVQKVFSTVKVAEGYVPIQVEVDNAGSSPALHTITYQESVTVCTNGPEHDRFPNNPPYADFHTWPSTAMLTPGTGGLTDPYIVNITHDRMIDLNMGRCTLYAYGIITYCDIFGRLHWQNYCGRWIPGTDTRFNTCYNYSDGDQDYPNETLSEISCPKSPSDIPPELLNPKHQRRRPVTNPR